jgi:hypothetical protein
MKTRIPHRSRHTITPGMDHLESRQLLSTFHKTMHHPVHHHHTAGINKLL